MKKNYTYGVIGSGSWATALIKYFLKMLKKSTGMLEIQKILIL